MNRSLTICQQQAYDTGVASQNSDLEAFIWAGHCDWMGAVDDLWSLFGMGRRGDELRWVRGWRYGAVPASGRSTNYREQQAEAGLSLMALDDGDRTRDEISALFIAPGRPIVWVSGLLISRRGGDGEPLVILAEPACSPGSAGNPS